MRVKAIINAMLAASAAALGHCSRCIAQSFVAAITSWTALLLLLSLSAAALPTLLVLLTAIGATCLWLLHLAAYAVRSTIQRRGSGVSVGRSSRRAAIVAFAKAMGVIAIATALPSIAFAGKCDCSKCS